MTRHAQIGRGRATAAARVEAMDTADGWPHRGFGDVGDLIALVRRVVASRVPDRDVVDDIVQETLTRLLAANRRLDDAAVGPYAIVTARNLVTSRWRTSDTGKRNEHRLFDPAPASTRRRAAPARGGGGRAGGAAGLHAARAAVLVAHEVDGRKTRDRWPTISVPPPERWPPS